MVATKKSTLTPISIPVMAADSSLALVCILSFLTLLAFSNVTIMTTLQDNIITMGSRDIRRKSIQGQIKFLKYDDSLVYLQKYLTMSLNLTDIRILVLNAWALMAARMITMTTHMEIIRRLLKSYLALNGHLTDDILSTVSRARDQDDRCDRK